MSSIYVYNIDASDASDAPLPVNLQLGVFLKRNLFLKWWNGAAPQVAPLASHRSDASSNAPCGNANQAPCDGRIVATDAAILTWSLWRINATTQRRQRRSDEHRQWRLGGAANPVPLAMKSGWKFIRLDSAGNGVDENDADPRRN